MSTPKPNRWGNSALTQLAASMASQEHVGTVGGLLLRLARFLGGDPSTAVSVTSTTTTDVHGLPDNTPAMSVILHVLNKPIVYSMDGTAPTAPAYPQLPVGTIIRLTGQQSIKAFLFASVSTAGSTLVGSYFD